MQKINKLEIGQILFGETLKEYEVSKIGNKYFECLNHRGKFTIESLRYYSPNYSQFSFQLYVDKQNIIDKKEINLLESKLRTKIGNYGKTNLTIEQLRKIDLIISEDGSAHTGA